jgi:hypothetical protein
LLGLMICSWWISAKFFLQSWEKICCKRISEFTQTHRQRDRVCSGISERFWRMGMEKK